RQPILPHADDDRLLAILYGDGAAGGLIVSRLGKNTHARLYSRSLKLGPNARVALRRTANGHLTSSPTESHLPSRRPSRLHLNVRLMAPGGRLRCTATI